MKPFIKIISIVVCLLITASAISCDQTEWDPFAKDPSDLDIDNAGDGIDLTNPGPDQDSDNRPASDTLVAAPLDSLTIELSRPGVTDLVYYASTSDVMKVEELDGNDSHHRTFKGDASCYDILEAYIDMLCSEYGFELAAEPYYQEYSTVFFDFSLNYIGEGELEGDKIEGTFSDVPGDIMIYGTIKYGNRIEGTIYYNLSLELTDQGYRYGSDASGKSYIGDSFGAGLYHKTDGSFRTDDGRLSVRVGEAMIISDGKEKLHTASFRHNNDASRQEIVVENVYGTQIAACYLPTLDTMSSGQIYTQIKFAREDSYMVRDKGVSDKPFSYTWQTMFSCAHGGKYVTPILGMTGEMTAFNMRIMYVDEDNIAVIYFCAQFKTTEKEIEGLIAVDIGQDTVAEDIPNEEYTVKVGDTIQITGPKVVSTGYDLWTWEYITGSGRSELSGIVQQTCTVKAVRVGDVRIKVTYEYSVKEPDVLTGNLRDVAKSETREYVIHIVN